MVKSSVRPRNRETLIEERRSVKKKEKLTLRIKDNTSYGLEEIQMNDNAKPLKITKT